jgi:rhodanese-related sulfurtransferase
MKLKLIFAFLMILVLALAACGGSDTAVSPPTAPESAEAVQPDKLDLPDTVDVQTVADVMNRDDVVLIDVREQFEYDEAHIPGVTLIPLGEVPERMDEIPTDKTVIITCRSGNRSGQATDFLRQNGFTNVHNMDGGINAWKQAGLPVEP